LNHFIHEVGVSPPSSIAKKSLQLLIDGPANLEVPGRCVETIRLGCQFFNIFVHTFHLTLILSLSSKDSELDGIDVIQGLVDLGHVPGALHDEAFASRAFFVLNGCGVII
jgi:hypothetical protein